MLKEMHGGLLIFFFAAAITMLVATTSELYPHTMCYIIAAISLLNMQHAAKMCGER